MFDESGNTYSWENCTPLIEVLNAIATVEDYQSIIDRYGSEFASQVWTEFEEHYPIETSVVAIQLYRPELQDPVEKAVAAVESYCNSWEDFCQIALCYGVSEKCDRALKKKFSDRLAEKGLSTMIKNLSGFPKKEAA